jgi:hypothetical protein
LDKNEQVTVFCHPGSGPIEEEHGQIMGVHPVSDSKFTSLKIEKPAKIAGFFWL